MERTVEALEQELKSEHHLYLRALADFDNFRRRIDRERANLGKEALRNFLVPLLDVIDDLERSLKAAETEKSPLVDGVRAVRDKFLRVLDAEGVRPFQSVGQPFDPSQHEAVGTAPAEGHPQGTVVQEVQPGYRWGDDLLRSARVVVGM
jgi:molecular chaperone GrpE